LFFLFSFLFVIFVKAGITTTIHGALWVEARITFERGDRMICHTTTTITAFLARGEVYAKNFAYSAMLEAISRARKS